MRAKYEALNENEEIKLFNSNILGAISLLKLDNKARMNYPGTVGSPNWEWKLKDHNWTKRIKYPDFKWFK